MAHVWAAHHGRVRFWSWARPPRESFGGGRLPREMSIENHVCTSLSSTMYGRPIMGRVRFESWDLPPRVSSQKLYT